MKLKQKGWWWEGEDSSFFMMVIIGSTGGLCEHGNEHFDSVNSRTFLDPMGNCEL